jgi:DNA-binding FadR family transcriptional regulator
MSLIALNVLWKDENRIKVSYQDHVVIVKAILSSDTEKAVIEVVQHFEVGKSIIIS